MLHKRAVTQSAIHPLIAERWSPRAFDPSYRITGEQLSSILEAGRWAPSCFGDQPWTFVVIGKGADDSAPFGAVFDTLTPKNKLWVKNASLLILTLAATTFRSGPNAGKPNRFAGYDTGAASLSMVLQAQALGLVAHQMAGFDAAALAALVEAPADQTCMALIAFGRQASADGVAEELRPAELAPRVRLPLTEVARTRRWSRPYVAAGRTDAVVSEGSAS